MTSSTEHSRNHTAPPSNYSKTTPLLLLLAIAILLFSLFYLNVYSSRHGFIGSYENGVMVYESFITPERYDKYIMPYVVPILPGIVSILIYQRFPRTQTRWLVTPIALNLLLVYQTIYECFCTFDFDPDHIWNPTTQLIAAYSLKQLVICMTVSLLLCALFICWQGRRSVHSSPPSNN